MGTGGYLFDGVSPASLVMITAKPESPYSRIPSAAQELRLAHSSRVAVVKGGLDDQRGKPRAMKPRLGRWTKAQDDASAGRTQRVFTETGGTRAMTEVAEPSAASACIGLERAFLHSYWAHTETADTA